MKRATNCLILSAILLFCFTSLGLAQETSIIGKWKTIDDETNKPKSIVEIFVRDGKFYGKIVKLFREPGEDPNPKCESCDDDDPRKGQPIIGMEIIKDLVEDDGEYSDGTILDPGDDAGDVYTCKLWLEDGKLMVRGYIAFFFRTQTWHKVE